MGPRLETVAMGNRTKPPAGLADVSPRGARLWWIASAWGPGLLVMLADTDAGNVVTAAQGGARWGHRLLPLILALAPLLYMIQELTVRLGVFTGRGHCELIRERFGIGWALLSLLGLLVATMDSLVTEFTGVAGVGELYGLPRSLTLPLAASALLAIVASGAHRRAKRAAIAMGLFLLPFLAIGWIVRPDFKALTAELIDLPLGDHEFIYMVAAIIGMTFNPWMVFYQQSAIAEKKVRPWEYQVARWDTAAGAVLTQLPSAAVLIAMAATRVSGTPANLSSIGEISGALSSVLGDSAGRIAFGMGVLGGSLAAALVSSLALAWGLGEIVGYGRSLQHSRLTKWFYCVFAFSVMSAAALVWSVRSLVWLNITAQVINAFMLPMVIGFLLALAAADAVPKPKRVQGRYLQLIIALSVAISSIGLFAAIVGLF